MGMELYESLKRGEDVRKNLIALKQELKEDAARDALQGELVSKFFCCFFSRFCWSLRLEAVS